MIKWNSIRTIVLVCPWKSSSVMPGPDFVTPCRLFSWYTPWTWHLGDVYKIIPPSCCTRPDSRCIAVRCRGESKYKQWKYKSLLHAQSVMYCTKMYVDYWKELEEFCTQKFTRTSSGSSWWFLISQSSGKILRKVVTTFFFFLSLHTLITCRPTWSGWEREA